MTETRPIIIAGAAKSGTSSLFDILCMHPSISGVEGKEVHFFSRDDRYARGIHYYNSLFAIDAQVEYTLDSSTSYLPSLKSHQRIYECYGRQVKIIVILRDPLQRIVSHYNYLRSLNIENRSFSDAILQDQKFDEESHIRGTYFNYLDFSRYGKSIANLNSLFGSENILIIPFMKLAKKSKDLQSQLETFLGITLAKETFDHKSNTTRRIVKHNSVLHKLYASIPAAVKQSSTMAKMKEYYLSGRVAEQKYKLSAEDKRLLQRLLAADLSVQEQLYPSIFKSWNL